MAVTAAIKFTQGFTTDAAGRALIGVLTTPVTVTNGDNSNVAQWTWEVIDAPVGSAIPIGLASSAAVNSYTFVPDQRGSYLLKLTTQDLAGNTAHDTRTFAVLETTGRLIPPFLATAGMLNFSGQGRGWAKYIEAYLHYLDSITSGLAGEVKEAVRAASTADINLAVGGLLTIDGVILVASDRVLVKNQATASQNGIYAAAAGAWSRTTDADTSAEVTAGILVVATEGTTQADTAWMLTTNDPIVLGTTALTFARFPNITVPTGTGWPHITSGVYDAASTDFVFFGTNPATAGYVRAPHVAGNNIYIAARNSGNTVNRSLVSLDGNDTVRFGDGTNLMFAEVAASDSVYNYATTVYASDLTATYGAFFYNVVAGKLTWLPDCTSVDIDQASRSIPSAAAAPFRITAQENTGATSTGGELQLSSGVGTTVAGNVAIRTGLVTKVTITPSKLVSTAVGRRIAVLSKTANYTVLTSDELISCDSSGGAFTITLPASPTTGDTYTVKDATGSCVTNAVTVAGNGKNIDGSASYVIAANYESITVVYTGTQWSIV